MTDKPKRNPTSFDVARLAGVSRSAVSRAYTKGAQISEDTRAKVFAAAQELGYRVNPLARSLQGQHSGIVGIVASRLDTPLRARQVRLLAQAVIAEGLRPMLLTAESPKDVGGLLDSLLSYSVAGMIVTSDTPPHAIIQDCERLGLPVVLINRDTCDGWGDRVIMDPDDAGKMAFDILHGAGARRLACLAPGTHTFSVTGRVAAFEQQAAGAGMPSLHLTSQTQSYASGRAAIAAAGDQLRDIDGLFCATDLMALGALDALRLDLGLTVPGDIQVVGFDNIEQTGWGAYDLTTIAQDLDQQCAQAMDLLRQRRLDNAAPQRTLYQTLTPVYRSTTKHDH